MSEPTQAEKCAELAKAMGWQQGESSGVWFSPKDASEICVFDVPPDPFTDHEACHALKVWLAGQGDGLKRDFLVMMECCLYDVNMSLNERLSFGFLWDIMTADPAIIAEAAWRSIQSTKQETT